MTSLHETTATLLSNIVVATKAYKDFVLALQSSCDHPTIYAYTNDRHVSGNGTITTRACVECGKSENSYGDKDYLDKNLENQIPYHSPNWKHLSSLMPKEIHIS